MLASLWDKTDTNGRNVVQSWAITERLSASERATLVAKLDVLTQTSFDLATRTRLIAGPLPDGKTYKLRAVNGQRTFILLLCRGPLESESQFTILCGAVEVDHKLTPGDSASRAEEMRRELLANPSLCVSHARFGSELTIALRTEQYRHRYAEVLLNNYIASQLITLRTQRGLSQNDLAKMAGTSQARIALLEIGDSGQHDLSTLRRIGSALGLRVSVGFESFGSLKGGLDSFRSEHLKRSGFEEDPLISSLSDILVEPCETKVLEGSRKKTLIQAKTDEEGMIPSDRKGARTIPEFERLPDRSVKRTSPSEKIAQKRSIVDAIKFDLFLSHASEDKERIARPLYNSLVEAGLTVWFDEAVLRLGDSLNGKIEEGLANCSHGIVIISPSFLNKRWTQRELAGLVAKEVASGDTKILPIWHDIDHSTLVQRSPTLADRVAGMSSEGVEELTRKILEAIKY